MTVQTLIILPGTATGEAILAEREGGTYGVRRLPVDRLAALNLSDVHLVLPGQVVRIFDTELPKAGRAQQQKMARFAREDDIAGSADDLHFALSDEQPPRLGVVDRSVMDALVTQLGALGAKAAYADYDLLTGEDEILVIDRAVEPGQAAIDLDWTEATLIQPTDAQLAQRFADGIAAGQGLNLLQGDYRARGGLDLPRVPLMRFGALAAMALVGWFVWAGVQDRAALAQAKELRAETAREYTAATGERAPTAPGRAAARAAQAGPAAPTGFLDLSSVLFTALDGQDDIRVDQLRYSASDGSLRLRLVYPSFDAAARVEAAVARAGGQLNTGGVREQGGEFIGEATLTLGQTS